ncbi:hypothetical protein J5491_03175 [Candidatus Saccharibacteria bacterium]|nr:hypothetical protein [Candidatus Saccharibacteria bacterium]
MKSKDIKKNQCSKGKPQEKRSHGFKIETIRGKRYSINHGEEFVRIEKKEGTNTKEWIFDISSKNWDGEGDLPRSLRLEVESLYL